MIETDRVVVHLLTGELLKGAATDYSPTRPTFHLKPADGGDPIEIQCNRLKALFFVKNLTGDSRRRDVRSFLAGTATSAKGNRIAIHFKDGELLTGYSMNYLPGKEGFVVFPSDPQSNNLRVYVLTAACQEIRSGPAATALVEKVRNTGKAS